MTAEVSSKPVSVEDGYEMVRDLIFYNVHKFTRMYGVEFDELIGDANELFVRGHQQYENGVTNTGVVITQSYQTKIRQWVWFGLFDIMRSRLVHESREKLVPLEDYDAPATDRFDANEFVDELSPDARLVADLVLNPPEAMLNVINGKGGTPRNYRSTVRTHLKRLGWSNDRINDAFEEITECLG